MKVFLSQRLLHSVQKNRSVMSTDSPDIHLICWLLLHKLSTHVPPTDKPWMYMYKKKKKLVIPALIVGREAPRWETEINNLGP